jgi:effector-binding domain-containing protein
LFGWLGQKGIEATGAPWARYLTVGPEEAELEIGAPVAGEVAGGDGILFGVRPACEVAWTVHVGPYVQMEPAYEAVSSWIAANGRLIAGAGWEFYETDPEQEPDPAKWRTRIVYPVVPAIA